MSKKLLVDDGSKIYYECPENGNIVTKTDCSLCPDPCGEEIQERLLVAKHQQKQEGGN